MIDKRIESAVCQMQSVIELGRVIRDRKTLPVKVNHQLYSFNSYTHIRGTVNYDSEAYDRSADIGSDVSQLSDKKLQHSNAKDMFVFCLLDIVYPPKSTGKFISQLSNIKYITCLQFFTGALSRKWIFSLRWNN